MCIEYTLRENEKSKKSFNQIYLQISSRKKNKIDQNNKRQQKNAKKKLKTFYTILDNYELQKKIPMDYVPLLIWIT